ncbi:MAG: hypothetical protein Q7J47_22550 [Azoarcus sp.]|nr:hypothetical protein [Azoarcus sp.]
MEFMTQDSGLRTRQDPDGVVCHADIFALASDGEELSALGVRLGRFNDRLNCFEHCVLTESALDRLVAMGGKYLWDPEPEPTLNHDYLPAGATLH